MAFPDLQTLNIFENANISSLVGVITTAIDEDTGENAVIYYYIVGKFDGMMMLQSDWVCISNSKLIHEYYSMMHFWWVPRKLKLTFFCWCYNDWRFIYSIFVWSKVVWSNQLYTCPSYKIQNNQNTPWQWMLWQSTCTVLRNCYVLIPLC